MLLKNVKFKAKFDGLSTFLCRPYGFNFVLKVRQIRNDFFKPTFLPKKNKFDFTTCRLVFVRFLEESEDTKTTFRSEVKLK